MFHTNYGRNIEHSATDICTFLKKTHDNNGECTTQHPHAAVSGSRITATQQMVRKVLAVYISLTESSCNLIAGDEVTCI